MAIKGLMTRDKKEEEEKKKKKEKKIQLISRDGRTSFGPVRQGVLHTHNV